jgi:hypothetical protein
MENNPVPVIEEVSTVIDTPKETSENSENTETELPTEPTINQ